MMVNVKTFKTIMFTFFGTWRCGFRSRCFAFIWALLHVRTFINPTHNPLALFHWKGLGRPKLTPLLTCFGLPILGGCWFFLLGILLGSHNDERRWNYNFMLFENCAFMFPPQEGTLTTTILIPLKMWKSPSSQFWHFKYCWI
jgi:hypothetical protein